MGHGDCGKYDGGDTRYKMKATTVTSTVKVTAAHRSGTQLRASAAAFPGGLREAFELGGSGAATGGAEGSGAARRGKLRASSCRLIRFAQWRSLSLLHKRVCA